MSVFAVLLVRVTMPARLLRLKMILKIDLKVAGIIVMLSCFIDTAQTPSRKVLFFTGLDAMNSREGTRYEYELVADRSSEVANHLTYYLLLLQLVK